MKGIRAIIVSLILLSGCSGPISDFGIEESIQESVGLDRAAVGNDHIQVVILDDSLDGTQQITIEKTTDYKKPKKDEALLLSPPVHISCEQEVSRFEKPMILVMALTEEDIEILGNEDNLYGAYYDGDNWHYIKPLEVNFAGGYFTFETYHFSKFTKSKVADKKKMEDFAKRRAVGTWSSGNNQSLLAVQTENVIYLFKYFLAS